MIDEMSSGFNIDFSVVVHIDYSVVILFTLTLVLSKLVDKSNPTSEIRGKIQTLLASGLVAAVSRVIPLYSSPLVLVPVVAILGKVFIGAVVSINWFMAQLSRVDLSAGNKVKVLVSVMVCHIVGALLAGYLSDYILGQSDSIPFVSKKALAQEFFFSVMVGFIGTKSSKLVPLVFLAGWLATVGPDMVHISSSVSFGADQIGEGKLMARIIWQFAGSFVGSFIISKFVDSERIDFDSILNVVRTTEGVIR